jgi:hypothetical protein
MGISETSSRPVPAPALFTRMSIPPIHQDVDPAELFDGAVDRTADLRLL